MSHDNIYKNANICIFVLTKNRSKLLIDMLESIKKSSVADFDCLIMDNNSDLNHIEATNQWIQSDLRFKLITWDGAHDGLENFERAFNYGLENYQYFAIVHDDDLLSDNWLRIGLNAAQNNPDVCFVNINAWLWRPDSKNKANYPWYPQKSGIRLFQTHADVANWMMSVQHLHFPSTLYVSRNCKDAKFDWPFGKVSDGYFLAELSRSHPIAIAFEPTYFYRIHSSQDSASIPAQHNRLLMNYITSNAALSTYYKPVNLYNYLLKNFIHENNSHKGYFIRCKLAIRFILDQKWKPRSLKQFARIIYYVIDPISNSKTKSSN